MTATATRQDKCEARTKSGKQCSRKADNGGKFCRQHAHSTAPKKEAPGRKTPRSGSGSMPFDREAFDEVVHDLEENDSLFGAANGSRKNRNGKPGFDDIGDFLFENVERFRLFATVYGLMSPERLEKFLAELTVALRSVAVAIAERAQGDYEEDDFGFDQRFTEKLLPLATLLYDWYWRVETDGLENVPGEGRALLVSNHAGAGLPFDGAMIKVALLRDHPSHRHARLLVLDWLMGLPWLADFMKKTGQVLACTPNAYELLRRDELVAVFPEGVKGMAKNFHQRYNLERFGRGGFVRIALRTQSPIIPVAVVGSEEIYPKIGNFPMVNKLIGAPFVPMTPFFPWFGLAGVIPLPSKWHIEFCEPVDVRSYPKEAAEDRTFVLELSERIRATIQQKLHENLLKRKTPFW